MTNHDWKVLTYYKRLAEENTTRSYQSEESPLDVAEQLDAYVYLDSHGKRRYDLSEEMLSDLLTQLTGVSHSYDYYAMTICKDKMPIRTREAFKRLASVRPLLDKLLRIWHCPNMWDYRGKG